jgi:hypothetical protein
VAGTGTGGTAGSADGGSHQSQDTSGGGQGGGGGAPPQGAMDGGSGGTAGSPAPACATRDVHCTFPSGGGIRTADKAFEDRIYKYDFTMAQDAWNALNVGVLTNVTSVPKKQVPAMLKIDGVPAVPDGPVGIRYKGESTLRDCAMTSDFMQRKCSIKVVFDELHPDDKKYRHFGLKKINLHALMVDKTALVERITYRMYREMHIPAARTAYALVTINGHAKGLYALVENSTDGRFTEDHWPADGQGNLYRQAWPGRLAKATEASFYDQAGRLETNLDAKPPVTHEVIIAFANDLKAAALPSAQLDLLKAALSKWSDPEWLARFMAVDAAVLNSDGPRQLVCKTSDCSDYSSHNYLWYQTKTNKFLLVPWDVDYSWGVGASSNGYSIAAAHPWDLAPTQPCATYRFKCPGGMCTYSLCDPIFKGINANRTLYVQAVKELLAGPYNVARLHKDIDDTVAKYLGAAVRQDPRMEPSEFNGRVAQLKTRIQEHYTRMQKVTQ